MGGHGKPLSTKQKDKMLTYYDQSSLINLKLKGEDAKEIVEELRSKVV
jgi:hypothetical protein